MTSTLRRTKAKALTLTRSVANTLKLSIGISTNQHAKAPEAPRHHHEQVPRISRPKQLRTLKRIPTSQSVNSHVINYLPSELLGHIFKLGSESDSMLPITVSHVCRTWRRIALRTPALWRQITLDSRLDMWKERIRRAKACSLDVLLVPRVIHNSRKRTHLQDMAVVQWYMHTVTPHIRRWRSLEVVFKDYSPYLWNAALSECCSIEKRAQAPLLEELILLFRNNDDSKEFFLFSNYAPRLRRVTLDGIKLTWTSSLFGNLTFLDYTHHGFSQGYAAAHEVLDMLRICPLLSELRILFPDKHPTHHHSLPDPLHVPPPVILTRLIDLQFRVEGSDIPFELAHVATLLQTPSLKRLHLVDVDRRTRPLPSISVFFSMYIIPRSLRILCIECGWYNDHTLASILRTPSSLQRLVLQRANMSQQILELAPTRLEYHAIRGWGRYK